MAGELERHRAKVTAARRVRNAAQLVALVEDFGFCFAFTLRPGDAPIPACFDHLSTSDEGRKWGWMWVWKDELAERKELYYGTLLARKPTFVALRLLPVFYATFGRAGEPDDHVEDLRAGRLSELGRRIVDFLAQHGETQTKRMRASLGITSQEGKRQYDRALDDVQRLMHVARVRAVGEGREDYNYTYDLFTRRYPDAVRAAERVTSGEARGLLLARAVELAGAITVRQARRLFDWDDDPLARTIDRLVADGRIARVAEGRDTLLLLPALAASMGHS
ncbi:MAG: AlkZ-related protein [Candidatus Limnocylindria bacterium]